MLIKLLSFLSCPNTLINDEDWLNEKKRKKDHPCIIGYIAGVQTRESMLQDDRKQYLLWLRLIYNISDVSALKTAEVAHLCQDVLMSLYDDRTNFICKTTKPFFRILTSFVQISYSLARKNKRPNIRRNYISFIYICDTSLQVLS